MSTLKIGAPNWIDPAFSVLSLGAWGTTRNNVQDPDFGNPALSTDATTASTQVGIDLTPFYNIVAYAPTADCLFIPKHNLTLAATITVKFGSAPFTAGGAGGGTVSYNHTFSINSTVYPPGTNNVFGKTVGNQNPFPVVDAAYNNGIFLDFGSSIPFLYAYVGISDTANPAGFVSIARLFLGPLYQPSFNMDYGVTIDLYGQRVADTSVTNADFIDPTPALRRLVSFNISDMLTVDEVTAYFLRLGLFAGFAKQLLFVYDPADTYHQVLRTFMVTQLKPVSLTYSNFSTGTLGLQLLEVL